MYTIINNNNNNDELFFKIWRCVIIKNEILFHLRLYNKHLKQRFNLNFENILKYKFKSYLNKIVFSSLDEIPFEKINFETLPYGISDIKIKNHDENISLSTIFNETSIPTSVHTIKFCNNIKLDKANLLPSSITSIKFGKSFNGKIAIGILPNGIKKIKFGENYNEPLEVGSLPSTLTSIKFGHSFNQSLNENWLPTNIKSLKFGNNFQQPIYDDINYLQKSLKSLILPIDYKVENINSKLISSLSSTKFSNDSLEYFYNSNSNLILFNSNSIPKSITKLKFDKRFNQIIKLNQISNNVKSIIFGKYFNSLIQVNSTLSLNLSSIEFGKNFNCPFNFETLENVKTIKFGNLFMQSLKNCHFPPNLTSLTFGNSFNSEIPSGYFLDLPLKVLVFGKFFNKLMYDKSLPSTLTSLDLGSSIFLKFQLPQLQSLIMGKGYNGTLKIGDLPTTLKQLSLCGNNFNSDSLSDFGIIPNGITSLSFGDSFNQLIENKNLPETITNLSFGLKFNKPIKINVLPSNLTSLSFNYHFNQPIEKGVLPNSLTSLSFEGVFNQNIQVGTLPNSITYLSLCYFYDKPFPIGSLPLSLKQLKIHSSKFNQDLSSSFDDYFTHSLETIFISKNSNLINILNSNFFSKFIKFYNIN
ncbi:hypothetical protein ACTFIR_006839 [Dictyostelium discoideum]